MFVVADMNPLPFIVLGGGSICAGIALTVAIVWGGIYLLRKKKSKPGPSDSTHPSE